MLDSKDDRVVDRGKQVLLTDGCIEEAPSLELGNHGGCGQGLP